MTTYTVSDDDTVRGRAVMANDVLMTEKAPEIVGLIRQCRMINEYLRESLNGLSEITGNEAEEIARFESVGLLDALSEEINCLEARSSEISRAVGHILAKLTR